MIQVRVLCHDLSWSMALHWLKLNSDKQLALATSLRWLLFSPDFNYCAVFESGAHDGYLQRSRSSGGPQPPAMTLNIRESVFAASSRWLWGSIDHVSPRFCPQWATAPIHRTAGFYSAFFSEPSRPRRRKGNRRARRDAFEMLVLVRESWTCKMVATRSSGTWCTAHWFGAF